jgi:hypothetical protein
VAHTHEVAGSIPAPASMADDLTEAIQQNAQGPASAEADGVKVTQHPLADQIAADKYLAGKDAVRRNPARAFARVKIVSPGAV